MKPIQQHKDPRITNISFDNFTGSISIITPVSDDDEQQQTENFMLSTSQTNANVDLFKPNHHLSLITQPILGARSRKKKENVDSLINSRQSSFNDSLSGILPNNRIERKSNQYESSDSGIDVSVSTNSSVQYQQQYPIVHRPLSALNEDLNTDEPFRQSEHIIEKNKQEKHSRITDNHQRKSLYKNDSNQLLPPLQQYQNHLTNKIFQKRRKSKLNLILETSSDIKTKNSNYQPIKPKSITPLDRYQNPEQIRAHINRSVIERQHPSYLTIPSQKQSTHSFHSNLNNQLTNPFKQNASVTSSRQMKPSLLGLNDQEKAIDDHQRKEKRYLNQINKYEGNFYQQQIEIKGNDIQQSLKPIEKEEQSDYFLTSTPRYGYEYEQINNRRFKEQYPINSKYKTKSKKFPIQSNNRMLNPTTIDLETKYSSQKTDLFSVNSHSRNLIHLSNNPNPNEHISALNSKEKLTNESINNLLRTTRIQPKNIDNIYRENELSRHLSKPNSQKNRNPFFPSRSPISWSIISDNQINRYQLSPSTTSSSSTNNQLTDEKPARTYQLIVIEEQHQQQQPIDGRYVIPTNTSQLSSIIDSSSQTSSSHTYPFTCTTDLNHINDIPLEHSPHQLIEQDKTEDIDDDNDNDNHRSSSSSSIDHFSPDNRFPLPLGKVTISMKDDDISTNYDSDDGWSDDSAELIYIDEQYQRQKKKIVPSSSSSSDKILQQHHQQKKRFHH